MKYTKKELKALKAFGEYIWCDRPYEEMEPRVYKKLGKYYHNLPKEVFSVPPSRSLYHVSRAGRTEKKLTDSGIVSCTTPKGKRYIHEQWCLEHEGRNNSPNKKEASLIGGFIVFILLKWRRLVFPIRNIIRLSIGSWNALPLISIHFRRSVDICIHPMRISS